MFLASKGFEVTGTDVSPSSLALARKLLASRGLGARLVRASAYARLPFGDAAPLTPSSPRRPSTTPESPG